MVKGRRKSFQRRQRTARKGGRRETRQSGFTESKVEVFGQSREYCSEAQCDRTEWCPLGLATENTTVGRDQEKRQGELAGQAGQVACLRWVEGWKVSPVW